jgi:uncharacterized protein YkwD
MKKIIILFLLAIQFVSAQTKLDSLVFEKVNQYRIENGLKEFKFDSVCFKASKHHTSYLVKTGRVGHSEDSLKEPKDRMKVFDKKNKWTIICEVALSTKPRNIKDIDIDINEKLATDVVNGWKSSKDHNNILLDKNCSFSGVSCFIIKRPFGINGINNYRVISTMLIVGGTYRKL